MLAGKWEKACKGVVETKAAFDDLSGVISLERRTAYEQEEQEALEKGGDALKVYGAKTEPCELIYPWLRRFCVTYSEFQLRVRVKLDFV